MSKPTMTATEMNMRINVRRRRAEGLAYAVFGKIRDYVAPDVERRVLHVILEAMQAEGVEVLTDQLRQEMGLPARGPDGWTIDELVALEARRLEVLYGHLQATPPPPHKPPASTEGDG